MKAAERALPAKTKEALHQGIPIFLRQLIRTLEVEQTPTPMRSREISGPSGGGASRRSEMGKTAAIHGRDLLEHGFTIDQVVHAYGDVCQALTDLAVERREPFQLDEFRTLNRCLDNAIAEAVMEFSAQRETSISEKNAREATQRLGFLAHELRNQMQTATLAFAAIKAGNVGLAGATSAVLDGAMLELSRLIDGSVSEVRIDSGMALNSQLFSLADLIVEVKIAAMLEAAAHDRVLNVSSVDPDLAVKADRHLLSSAVGNLLQNAFKFTHPGTEVTLVAYATDSRIQIDVADHCGGLPSRTLEELTLPFIQASANRSGLGLGLSIVRRNVEAIDGILRVRNHPGVGCTFTIDLPRHAINPGGGVAWRSATTSPAAGYDADRLA